MATTTRITQKTWVLSFIVVYQPRLLIWVNCMTSWDCHKTFFSGKIKIHWARIFRGLFLWSHSPIGRLMPVFWAAEELVQTTNNVHWDDCFFFRGSYDNFLLPLVIRQIVTTKTLNWKMNMEPKNEGGWKIIFLLNWVTFRFQPFMFRGVFNMVACDSKLIPSKGSSHWRSRAMSSSTVWCITLRSMRSSLHNFPMPRIICRCQKEKVDMWVFEKKQRRNRKKNAYIHNKNQHTWYTTIAGFLWRKRGNKQLKVSILRFFGPGT